VRCRRAPAPHASIKGTAFDRGQGPTIEGKIVAEKFWELYQARKDVRTTIR